MRHRRREEGKEENGWFRWKERNRERWKKEKCLILNFSPHIPVHTPIIITHLDFLSQNFPMYWPWPSSFINLSIQHSYFASATEPRTHLWAKTNISLEFTIQRVRRERDELRDPCKFTTMLRAEVFLGKRWLSWEWAEFHRQRAQHTQALQPGRAWHILVTERSEVLEPWKRGLAREERAHGTQPPRWLLMIPVFWYSHSCVVPCHIVLGLVCMTSTIQQRWWHGILKIML